MQIFLGVDNYGELVFYDTSDTDFFTCRLESSDIDLSDWYQESYEGCGDDALLEACRRYDCGPDSIGEKIFNDYGESDYIECNCSQCEDYEVCDDGRCVYWITDSSSGANTNESDFKFFVSKKLYNLIMNEESTRDEIEELALNFNRDTVILYCVQEGIIDV